VSRPTTRSLTIRYFSLVAIALIAVHSLVYERTQEAIEQRYAENRLAWLLEKGKVTEVSKVVAEAQERLLLYRSLPALPDFIAVQEPLEQQTIYQFYQADTQISWVVLKTQRPEFGPKPVWLAMDNSLYELSEEQSNKAQIQQVLLSLLLLGGSLLVVFALARRLANPIADLAARLASRGTDQQQPLALSEPASTQEIAQLLETFNRYQLRIAGLIERERAFNRYASHELRTPLMVMSGSLALLAEYQDDPFVNKQRQRLEKAVAEMTEFVDVLLCLHKEELGEARLRRPLERAELAAIINQYSHHIEGKPLSCQLQQIATPEADIPASVLQILLGNLLKNAFTWSESGQVELRVEERRIQVIDQGAGLASKVHQAQGNGLGLLIVRDICHRYGWRFELADGPNGGCIASLSLPELATLGP